MMPESMDSIWRATPPANELDVPNHSVCVSPLNAAELESASMAMPDLRRVFATIASLGDSAVCGSPGTCYRSTRGTQPPAALFHPHIDWPGSGTRLLCRRLIDQSLPDFRSADVWPLIGWIHDPGLSVTWTWRRWSVPPSTVLPGSLPGYLWPHSPTRHSDVIPDPIMIQEAIPLWERPLESSSPDGEINGERRHMLRTYQRWWSYLNPSPNPTDVEGRQRGGPMLSSSSPSSMRPRPPNVLHMDVIDDDDDIPWDTEDPFQSIDDIDDIDDRGDGGNMVTTDTGHRLMLDISSTQPHVYRSLVNADMGGIGRSPVIVSLVLRATVLIPPSTGMGRAQWTAETTCATTQLRLPGERNLPCTRLWGNIRVPWKRQGVWIDEDGWKMPGFCDHIALSSVHNVAAILGHM